MLVEDMNMLKLVEMLSGKELTGYSFLNMED